MTNRQKIISGSRVSIGAVLLGLGGAGLLVVACVRGNIHFAIGAALPAALAACVWCTRPPSIRIVVSETGLSVNGSYAEIPFASIQCVTMAGKAQDPEMPDLKPGPIVLAHGNGVLEIPKNLSVAVTDLYRALLRRVPESGSRRLDHELAEHLQQEQETFGAERVFTFAARHCPQPRRMRVRAVACSLAVGVTGFFWIAAEAVFGLPPGYTISPWVGLGILLIVVGILTALIISSAPHIHRAAGTPGRIQASLIVSPTGIAMRQDDMCGQLRWDELLDIQLGEQRGPHVHVHDPRTGAIRLRIAGAVLEIPDVYDRPLPIIYRVIRRYWRPT